MRITKGLREDYIFINQVVTRTNTSVSIMPEATTISSLRVSPSRWWMQRCEELRSLSLCERCSRYPAFLESILRLIYYAFVIAALLHFAPQREILYSLLAVELLRNLGLSIVFTKSARKLGEKGILFPLLCWNFIYPFVHLVLVLTANSFSKDRRMRQRR